jgi:polysaccharide export outer membrane protein
MKIFFKIASLFTLSAAMLLSMASCANPPIRSNNLDATALSTHGVTENYEIGPEDVLEVLVWKNESLSKVVTVRPDGKISLPLIGDVHAAGQTTEQVREAIAEKLSPYYKEPPQVSLIVKEVNSYVIYVMGEVQRPAQYLVKRGTTFLQAIALAGGFTPFASTNDVIILRRAHENNGQLALNVRYKDIIAGDYEKNNILLKSGDTVIIP